MGLSPSSLTYREREENIVSYQTARATYQAKDAQDHMYRVIKVLRLAEGEVEDAQMAVNRAKEKGCNAESEENVLIKAKKDLRRWKCEAEDAYREANEAAKNVQKWERLARAIYKKNQEERAFE